MNIIEPVWGRLQARVARRKSPPSNSEELWAALKDEWYGIEPEYIAALYESMPRRVQAVLAADGWNTKY